MTHTIKSAYEACNYRTATHQHETRYVTDALTAAAVSDTGKASPRSVGLCNSYARKAFFVTTSAHSIFVRADWSETVAARGAAVVDGMLTLSLEDLPREGLKVALRNCTDFVAKAVWVVQGRGTALKTITGYMLCKDSQWIHHGSERGLLSAAYDLSRRMTAKAEMAKIEAGLTVTYQDAREAGLCVAGIADWLERRGLTGRTEISAVELRALAESCGDRKNLVERAIAQAVARVLGVSKAA